MPKVLISPAVLANLQGPFREELAAAGFEMIFPPVSHLLSESETLELLQDIPACLCGSEAYPRRVLEALPNLRVLARAGVGYDAIDIAAATELGIAVTYAPGSNQEAVAEHSFLLILTLAKQVFEQDRLIRQGIWPRKPYMPLRGKTIGIVGLGRIGKAVTTRAQAFGMRVLAAEIAPDEDFIARHRIELVPQEQLFREADFVTLHVPLTPQTRDLINADTLRLMKPDAYLINTSRGKVVDENALAEALQRYQIAGAGLDVFREEPTTNDHPLIGLDNVILTAHTAGVDQRSVSDMGLFAARGIIRLSQGDWPTELIVNPEVRSRFRWDG